MKPTILFTTSILKYPPTGGPYIRIQNTIKTLSRISNLHIYCRSSYFSIGGAESINYYRTCSISFQICPYDYLNYVKAPLNIIANTLFQKNVFSISLETEKCYKDFLSFADIIHPDVIWLGYGNISYSLLRYIKQYSSYKVVVDTDSVFSRFYLRGMQYLPGAPSKKVEIQGKLKEKEELWGTKLADITTAVSEIDANYYKKISDNPKKIQIFSNIVDTSQYLKRSFKISILKQPYVLLPGTFGWHSAMDDAARWFIKKILPLIRKKIPELNLYIAGFKATKSLSDVKEKFIHIIDNVPSMVPYFQNACIVIVPLRFESGTRLKILEAGACGKPVVSTTLGAEGLIVQNGVNILLADSPIKFSEQIMKLIKNKKYSQMIGNNLKLLVQKKYSIDSSIKEAEKILHYLI